MIETDSIFQIRDEDDFRQVCLDIFHFQATQNPVYKDYLRHLDVSHKSVNTISDIPFLPVSFFKDKTVYCHPNKPETIFTSSGTLGRPSLHHIADLGIYKHSFLTTFEQFYRAPDSYCILALLPSYLEREGSSLIYMVKTLIEKSGHPDSGFYLYNYSDLAKKLAKLENLKQQTLLIGVSFALLDFAEQYPQNLCHTTVMETGGMKGTRKELIRHELHECIQKGLGVNEVHSEYGMTELLTQAYSKGHGIFYCPPWMRIITRDIYDPFCMLPHKKSGGINIIDLANVYSCSFIETQDLGKTHPDGSFDVLGRFDNTDVRGCNLLVG